MLGSTSLEVYNSIFNIADENNKIELYTQPLNDEFSYTQFKDNIAEILGLSDISPEDLQHEIRGPKFLETYTKLSTEKSQVDGFYMLLLIYLHSPFRDFECYLRILTGLNDDDFQIMLKQYNSEISKHKNSPGANSFRDLSEVVSKGFEIESEIRRGVRPNHKHVKSHSIIIDIDNISLITKLNLSPQIHVLRFNKNPFFITILGFTLFWGCESYDNEYYIEKKNRILSTIDKIHLKCDVIDGGVVNGVRQPILFSFILDKPSGSRVLCEPETFHYKKYKSVLNTITFNLEDDNHEKKLTLTDKP